MSLTMADFINGHAGFADLTEEVFDEILHVASKTTAARKRLPGAVRSRYTAADKVDIINESHITGNVSATARKHGMATRLLFSWRAQEENIRQRMVEHAKRVEARKTPIVQSAVQEMLSK